MANPNWNPVDYWEPDYSYDNAKKQGKDVDLDSEAANAGYNSANNVHGARDAMDQWRYTPDASAWNYEEGKVDPWYEKQMAATRGVQYNDQYDQAARANEQAQRKAYQDQLNFLRPYATGQQSNTRRQMPYMQQQYNQMASSQLASQDGAYNPATARASQMARSEGAAQMDVQGRIAAEQERQAAQNAYLAGTQNLQKQDLSMMQSEAQRAQAIKDFMNSRQKQEDVWYQQGLSDNIARTEAQQQYEKAMADLADYDIDFARSLMQQELGGED